MLHDDRTGNELVMQQRRNTEALTDRRAVMVYPYLNYITTYIQSLALQMSHRLRWKKKFVKKNLKSDERSIKQQMMK